MILANVLAAQMARFKYLQAVPRVVGCSVSEVRLALHARQTADRLGKRQLCTSRKGRTRPTGALDGSFLGDRSTR